MLSTREIHIFDSSNYTTYTEAKESGAVRTFDVSHADDSNCLSRGALADVIAAMECALTMVGQNHVGALLIVDGVIVDILVA